VKSDPYPWRALGVLSALASLALVLSFPLPPQPAVFVPGVVVIVVVAGMGLLLGRSVGLGAPLLAGRRAGTAAGRDLAGSFSFGAATGAALAGATLLWLALIPGNTIIRSRILSESVMPIWMRVVMAFDAAVLEEILFRLFLVSFLVWILDRACFPSRRWPRTRKAWLAISVVAVGFGLAHLPRWLAEAPVSAGLAISVVILNGIGGLAFGFLYYRRGIEAAMLGHFAADIVVHVLGPMLG
jgi:hypothetical protein